MALQRLCVKKNRIGFSGGEFLLRGIFWGLGH